ncbi:MAG: glycosyltransferase [Spirochaetales bacterium]|nr:glycosyltransferase [Spirochaetales bacterium]
MRVLLLPDENTMFFYLILIGLLLIALIVTHLKKYPDLNKKKTAGFRLIAVCSIVFAAYYLYWRYRYSLNLEALWFAIPLVLAETYAFIDSILFAFMMLKPTDRKTLPPHESASVDIYITTYNEDPELVETTMEAAQEILWNDKKVFILDDGDRPEIKTLAQTHGCQLITRGEEWRGKPRHAKAGNVNNALLQTSGDFILILDADHIPSPQIIKNTIGYFQDDKVAFVQTPQHFYNTPPGDPFGSDAPLFYGPILQGKDGWNSAFFCGSNAILRREALLQLGITEYSRTMVKQAKEKISAMRKAVYRFRPTDSIEKSFALELKKILNESGKMLKTGKPVTKVFDEIRSTLSKTEFAEKYPEAILPGLSDKLEAYLEITRGDEAIPILPLATSSVTEDMATSIRLHSLGWRSIFHHEILAQGLAPEDLASALSQKLRWAQGTIQVLLKENPLTVKGLSIAQRLQYFTTIFSYFSGFANLIFILSPLVFLTTRIAPVTSYSAEFLWRLIPFLLFNRLMFKYIARGTNVRRGEQYSLALFPVWIKAVTSVLLGRNPEFVVTPKQRQGGRFLNLIKIQLICIILSCAAILFSIIMIISGTPYSYMGLGINLFWTIYNISNLSIIVKAAVYSLPEGWNPRPDPDLNRSTI